MGLWIGIEWIIGVESLISLSPLVCNLGGHIIKTSLEVPVNVFSEESGMTGPLGVDKTRDEPLSMGSSIEEVETAEEGEILGFLVGFLVDFDDVIDGHMPEGLVEVLLGGGR